MRISGLGPGQPSQPGRPAVAAGLPADGLALGEAGQILSEIQQRLKGPTTRWDERRILELLRSAGAEDLNLVLQGLELRRLFQDVDNHWAGPKNYDALLKLLTKDRLGDLTVSTRAAVVDGLMRGPTRTADERAIRDIFLGTGGSDLTELKNRVDAGSDRYDLQQLLYHELDDRAIRAEVVDHFHRQSKSARTGELKVMSDIDDTFYSNLKDAGFPKGTVYPGVRQYYAELDAGSRNGDLTFLTARPDDGWGAIKERTHRSLARRGVEQKVVVVGTLTSLISNQKIAARKYENFQQYNHIFPEYDFVFTGDSGQGDVMLAEKLYADPDIRLQGAFIHDVVNTPSEVRERYREKGIVFFDTYLGAALAARERGLMTLEGAERVGRAAVQEFSQTWFESESQRQGRLRELQTDLDALNALLPPDRAVQMPPLPPLDGLRRPDAPEEASY